MNKHILTLLLAASVASAGCPADDEKTADAGTGSAGADTGSAGTGSAGTGSAGTGSPATKSDIVATAVAAGSFSKLADALTQADLVSALQGPGPFTVFAPNDDAFAAFEAKNPGVLAGLSKADLAAILQYHVVSGHVTSSELKDGGVATTLNGAPVLFDLTSGAKVDDSKVLKADIECTNGVIHVIDAIMLPPKDDLVATAVAAGSFTKLADALTSADLVGALQAPGPFTVFAPTDAAFAKLSAVPSGDALANVLLYHVVMGAVGSGDLVDGDVPTLLTGKSVKIMLGDSVMVNDATVTKANILAKNGIIHVIDTVLVPK